MTALASGNGVILPGFSRSRSVDNHAQMPSTSGKRFMAAITETAAATADETKDGSATTSVRATVGRLKYSPPHRPVKAWDMEDPPLLEALRPGESCGPIRATIDEQTYRLALTSCRSMMAIG